LVSGFYEHDAVDIERKAKEAGLTPIRGMATNGWCSLVYERVAFPFAVMSTVLFS
jgi:ribosomal protein L11 methyltransferase